MDSIYMLIFNIPPSFHSSDLRSFFSDFIERQTHFSCFHFRHRPQLELVKSFEPSNFNKKELLLTKDAVCCIVKCSSKEAQTETIKKYHLLNWVDKNDRFLSSCCIGIAVTVVEDTVQFPVMSFCLTNNKMEFKLSKKKIEEMFELKPPLLMPKGNIGTPTKHFLELINTCRLPSTLIGKLGLHFPKTKSRRYGSVPFNYGNHKEGEKNSSNGPAISSSENGRNTYGSSTSPTNKKDKNEEKPLDDDEEQEWDRHEALHDDVTEQERNKERLYEEEMEVVWEKGGPGIVWYTDAQLWKEAEGDFDEQTTDDWDVDYSVYFEENGGDKDARDLIEMRQSTMWRQGNEESVFKKPSEKRKPRNLIRPLSKSDIVGPFEQHTRGIGRRLMEKHGWRDGIGLGRSQKGIAKPIESEGQKPRERKGLGYFGERIPRFNATRQTNKGTGAFIATIYDRPSETDPPEPLLQRNEPTTMKYRYM